MAATDAAIARRRGNGPNWSVIHCSGRLPWDAPHNPHSRLLDRLRGEGRPLIDLTVSDPTRVGLSYPAFEVAAALANPGAAAFVATPRGAPSARQAIAAAAAARGIDVDADDVLLTASTSEAYALLFKLLCDPGDRVLCPRPSYPLFDYLAALEGVALEPYRLGFDGRFHLDLAALQQALDRPGPPARAIIVVSPNNPTGNFVSMPERAALLELAAARQLPVISDEVFAGYGRGDDRQRAASLGTPAGAATVFCLDGISKSLGLPQLKLGWIRIAGEAAERRRLMGRLELIADTYLSVGAPVQLALPRLLALGPAIAASITHRCGANLAALHNRLDGSAATVLPVEGGWAACVRLPATRSDEAWALELLERCSLVVQPGYFYDFEEPLCVVVVSLLCEPESFACGIEGLRAYLRSEA